MVPALEELTELDAQDIMKVPATVVWERVLMKVFGTMLFIFLQCSLIGQEVQGLPCVQRYVPRYKVQQAGASDAGRHDAYRNSSHRGVAWDILTGTFLLLMIYNPPTTKPPMTKSPTATTFSTGSIQPRPPSLRTSGLRPALASPLKSTRS